MNSPLSGSEANACTETKIPDLTKNVPNRLNEKAARTNALMKAGKKTGQIIVKTLLKKGLR